MLKKDLSNEKRIIEYFLEENIPIGLIKEIRKLKKDIEKQIGTQIKIKITSNLTYWELLRILLKFPAKYQIGLNDEILKYFNHSPSFKLIKDFISIKDYKNKTLISFLTDCLALYRLKIAQLKLLKEIRLEEDPYKKLEEIINNFKIIPTRFLLEKRLLSDNYPIEIYKGVDLFTLKDVVIKILPQEIEDYKTSPLKMSPDEVKKRFYREARAFERLEDHQRAVESVAKNMSKKGYKIDCFRYFVKTHKLGKGRMHNYIFENGLFKREEKGKDIAYLVMEYIEGDTLREFIDRFKKQNSLISLDHFFIIMEGILRALNYCHNERIVHRDIRPENIIIGKKDYKVRLTNLGYARVEDMTQLTAQGTFVGTPAYAAPEGIYLIMDKRKSKKSDEIVKGTDHRFDIYSAGCVAYEILTGDPPFTSNKKNPEQRDIEILKKHLKEKPKDLTLRRSDIPPEINKIVLKMLEKDPNKRYQSVKEVLEELNKIRPLISIIKQEALRILYPSNTQKIILKKKRYKKVLIGIFLIIILIGSGYFFIPYKIKDLVKRKFFIYFTSKGKYYQESEDITLKLDLVLNNLKQKLNKSIDLYEEIYNKFLQEKSKEYPSLSYKINIFLKRAREEVHLIENEIKKLKNIEKSSKIEKFLKLLKSKYNKIIKKSKEVEKLIDRILSKLNQYYELAKKIEKSIKEEERIRREANKIRFYLYSLEESLTLIDEKLSILRRDYPQEKKYPTIDKKMINKIEKNKKELKKLSKKVEELNKALLKNDFRTVKKIIQKYSNISKRIEELEDIEDNIDQTLKACELLKKKRERKKIIDQAFIFLQKYKEDINNKLNMIQTSIKTLKELDKSFTPKKEIFNKINITLKNLKNIQLNLSKNIEERKEEKAVSLAKTFLNNKDFSNIIYNMNSYKEKIEDKIKLIKAVGQIKKEKKLQKKILNLLSLSKNTLNQLKLYYNELQKEIEIFKKEFPNKVKYLPKKIKKKAEKIISLISNIIYQSEKFINKKKLLKAYNVLSKKKKIINYSNRLINYIKREKEKIYKKRQKYEKSKERKEMLARAKRTLKKLEKYITLMKNLISPIEKEINLLRKKFPPQQGYPTISNKTKEILTNSKKYLNFYIKSYNTSKKYLEKNIITKAFEILSQFEGKRLQGYKELYNYIKYIQEDISKTKQKCRQLKAKIKQIQEIKKYKNELLNRIKELKRVIPSLEKKFNLLSRYSSQVYKKLPDAVKKYIKEAKIEIEQLNAVLKEADESFKKERYYEALMILKPYSNDVNPGISLLPLLKTYEKSAIKYLNFNKKIDNNPNLKREILKKLEEEKKRLENLKKWRRAPGEWYKKLKNLIDYYTKIEKEISYAIRSKGSRMVFNRIRSDYLKIQEYPDLMAELKELEVIIKKKGKKIPKRIQTYKDKIFVKYLSNKKIEIDVQNELSKIERALEKIKEELKSSWVEEETLRTILRALESIIRKFDEIYQPIKGKLLNLSSD